MDFWHCSYDVKKGPEVGVASKHFSAHFVHLLSAPSLTKSYLHPLTQAKATKHHAVSETNKEGEERRQDDQTKAAKCMPETNKKESTGGRKLNQL